MGEMTAVIMAGGEGLRCRPLTLTTPKPMLPVGGKPLLEILVRQLVKAGVERLWLNVRYLREQIEDYFQNGRAFGAEIRYLREPEPYGTVGGLSLIPVAERPATPFLVVNGDVLTPIDFAAFRDFHIAEGFALTLVGREYQVTLPYGYPMRAGKLVADFWEKPTFSYTVNSGIYCLNPEVIERVAGPGDMPALIRHTCYTSWVGVYLLTVPFHEIGTPESYTAAERFYTEHMCGL